jgi:hypothetical protein
MPSSRDNPPNLAQVPRQSRLKLYSDLSLALKNAMAEHAGIEHHPDHGKFVAATVTQIMTRMGYRWTLNGEAVNLSRYEERDDPEHTWR